MQLVLAILIAVTQVASPWLCCCGPSRIASTFQSGTRKQPIPAKEPPVAHCPHCAAENPTPSDPTSPPKPIPTERCPCGGVEFVAVPPAASAVSFDLDQLVSVVFEFDAPFLIEIAILIEPSGLRELPFLTTAERLYAHHVLRC